MRNKKRLKDSALCSLLSALRSPKGFTAIEAVIIVVILSILTVSAVVSYRLTNQDKATIAADQLIADIQYVQMRAMGIGSSQNITFTINSSGYNAAGEQKNLTGDIQVISTNFGGSYNNSLYFNSLGEPCLLSNPGPPPVYVSCASLTPSDCIINIGKGTTTYKTLTIYAITGKGKVE